MTIPFFADATPLTPPKRRGFFLFSNTQKKGSSDISSDATVV